MAHQPSVERQELVLQGIGVAPGIAIGPVYLYARDAFTVEERRLNECDIQAELERFEQAVSRSENELRRISSVAREKLGEESAGIFEAQALMLRDQAVYDAVVDRIKNVMHSADFAVHDVMTSHRRVINASESEYLRERANDLLDVQERIIRQLRRGKIVSAIDRDTIVIAESLSAADIILFSRRNILGCAIDFGGPTSHVSIMARALNVPAVVSLHGVTEVVKTGDLVVLDGLHGRVVINPTPETLNKYRVQQERYRHFLEAQKFLTPLVAETLDGHRISLRANVELKEEIDWLKEFGAEGIGLFRTEMLFLMQGRVDLSEEEQFGVYRKIVERVGPAVTTFRVLDLGGDKVLPLAHREMNPFLGWRGIRILLEKTDLLVPQIRAILRASAFGPLRILLPMITDIKEVRLFKDLLEKTKAALREEGKAMSSDVPVGIMVEVPAVVLSADIFAKEVDFFSIGSNDLTQYTLAVDRGNDLVSQMYEELHPAVLSLIKMTVEAARAHSIPVGICGELAANPEATPILVGLGLTELSLSPRYVPEVKRIIRAIRLEEARQLAERAVVAENAAAVAALTSAWLKERAYEMAHLEDN